MTLADYGIIVELEEDAKVPDCTGDIISIQLEDALRHVHSGVLSTSSKFFKNAIKDVWQHDGSKAIDLSDVNSTVFDLYIQWLYTGRITKDPPSKLNHGMYQAQVYVLGEKIMDVQLQNAVLATIITDLIDWGVESTVWSTSQAIVALIYDGTPSNNPARKLLVDMWKRNATVVLEQDATFLASMCNEFLADLALALYALEKKDSRLSPHFGSMVPYMLPEDAE
ncbi:hypothetical protein ACN47E_007140 [Coniothyrium glycines]